MARLNDEQIAERLAGGPWRREGDAIVRDLEFADFAAAIAFVNRVADAAERADHHPDILVHAFNNVQLTLSDHAAGGITDADLEMAGTLEALDR